MPDRDEEGKDAGREDPGKAPVPQQEAITPPDAVVELYARFPYPPAETPGRRWKRKIRAAVSEGREIAEELLRRHPPVATGRILDAGCGTGLKLLGLAQALPGARLLGIHVSRASLETARRILSDGGVGNAELTTADLSLGLKASPDPPFDAVVCDGVLHHLHDPEAALGDVAGLLKPGGVAWITLFGKHGRAEIGRLRSMINVWNPRFLDFERRLAAARGFLGATGLGSRRHAEYFEDDAFLADAVLNPRETWFDLVSARRFFEGAGLVLESWPDGEKAWRDLAARLKAEGMDPDAREEPLSEMDRMRLAELWKGPGMLRFVVRKPGRAAGSREESVGPGRSAT
jgi:SAM-dependent methyltransferase